MITRRSGAFFVAGILGLNLLIVVLTWFSLALANSRHHLAEKAAITALIFGLISLVSITAGGALFFGRKRNMAADESLRAGDEQLRLFFERQIVGMAISTPDKRWARMNDKWCQILGYEREELEKMTWEELTYPDDLAENIVLFDQLAAGIIDDYTITKRFVRRDGSIIVAELSVGCVRDEDGTLNCLLSLMEDITERTRAEEIFRTVFSSAPIGLILMDSKSVVLDCNQHFGDIFGSRREAYLGMNLLAAIPQGAVRKNLVDTLSDGAIHHYEGPYVSVLTGKELFISITSEKVTPDLYITVLLDISERMRAEQQILDEKNFSQTILKTTPVALIIYKATGETVSANEAAARIVGTTIGSLETQNFRNLESWAHSGMLDIAERALAIGTEQHSEFHVKTTFGNMVELDCLFVPFLYSGEQHLMLTAIDISERKHAEEEHRNLEKQLLHTQKLESLGILAGGIAHDFNNILTSIIGNADLALMKIVPESPAVDNLHRIEQAASRAADLAKQMLAYSGKGKFIVENLDMNRLLEEMIHMLEISISKKAVLRLNASQNIPSVEADATQMRQIIMNLVINASEAIGDKSGVIEISTGSMDCDGRYLKDVWLDMNISEGLYVYLEIADTGCGMDGETMSKLFDPFFTTKFTGRGLGMAAVLGIVRGHKGAIKVYSEPGKGSTFKILLPASDKPSGRVTAELPRDNWQGTGTALLVDDEETIRAIGAEMLQELGFTALTASDGREAIEVFTQNPDIAFVILDLTMPHMDGEQCFRELRRMKPDIRVIISSGFNEHEVTQKFAGKGLAGFVQKPYRFSALLNAVKRIAG
jgi:PAS domain S-box-containing protein